MTLRDTHTRQETQTWAPWSLEEGVPAIHAVNLSDRSLICSSQISQKPAGWEGGTNGEAGHLLPKELPVSSILLTPVSEAQKGKKGELLNITKVRGWSSDSHSSYLSSHPCRYRHTFTPKPFVCVVRHICLENRVCG